MFIKKAIEYKLTSPPNVEASVIHVGKAGLEIYKLSIAVVFGGKFWMLY